MLGDFNVPAGRTTLQCFLHSGSADSASVQEDEAIPELIELADVTNPSSSAAVCSGRKRRLADRLMEQLSNAFYPTTQLESPQSLAAK